MHSRTQDEVKDSFSGMDSSQERKNSEAMYSPIFGVEPTSNNSDLGMIKEIIGSSSVVALGEGTHGTSEFFRMKHRVIKYLVSELGFSIFCIEANMPSCEKLNQFILHGKGVLTELLAELRCYFWNKQEVYNMLQWMREYNLKAEVKIQFIGFDFQGSHLAEEIVKKSLLQANIKISQQINDLSQMIMKLIMQLYPFILSDDEKQLTETQNKIKESDDFKLLMQEISLLKTTLDEKKSVLLQQMTEKQFHWIKQNLRILEQDAVHLVDKADFRDSAMAENILWVQSQNPGCKIIVWAHNGHIQKDSLSDKRMGHFLAAQLGDQYCALALTTYQGTYTARNKSDQNWNDELVLKTPPENTIEAFLHKMNIPMMLVNLHYSNKPQFMLGSIKSRCIGAVEEDDHSYMPYHDLSKAFDGILFIDKTSASQPIKAKKTNPFLKYGTFTLFGAGAVYVLSKIVSNTISNSNKITR